MSLAAEFVKKGISYVIVAFISQMLLGQHRVNQNAHYAAPS